MSGANKLKILCLHGMIQNSTVFRKKTAVLRKKLEKVADLVYVTAPHLVLDLEYTTEIHRIAAAEPLAHEELKPFGWWQPVSNHPSTPDGYYQGFKESIEYLKGVLIEQGPFDGVLGFSQGACLAAMLSELLENRLLVPDLIPQDFAHPAFRFAIIAAGFKPMSQEATSSLFQTKIQTPSLHLIGEADTVIPPERMMDLADAFVNPAVFKHAGGHLVPTNAASKNEVFAFISKFQ
ncbi:serine hydrolase FSH [Zychaea mexicana]|uniref:serine hydrolase FSH n=1 Tax=Zychaea mexicana TaxID=64656 RepID=UPI0022FDD7B6|nr:serine hydrolase FSH [Zychaea mexicana]KAI9497755.1 serine hydrolase FSH [Zychaea mexicana]